MTKRVKIISEAEVFRKAIFRIREARLQHERYDGQMSDEIVRLNLERGDSVAALVHDTSDDVFIMTEQFRYPTYEKGPGWIIEVPAGIIEEGEQAAETMQRELIEEIGYTVTSFHDIGLFYVSPGGTSERIHLFYAAVDGASHTSEGGGADEEHEDIRVIRPAVDDALAALNSGDVVDAKTIIALQWFALNRRSLDAEETPEGGSA